MFPILLVVTFLVALAVTAVVAWLFRSSIDGILQRIIPEKISAAWLRYLQFAIYVVGVSSGVRIWELEKYITPAPGREGQVVALTRDRWILEVYRSVIESLQGIAWLLLVFFVFALIAYVIVRLVESRRPKAEAA